MPAPDKIRPWITMRCGGVDCEFTTAAEWEARRHEHATGHTMDWPQCNWDRLASGERRIEGEDELLKRILAWTNAPSNTPSATPAQSTALSRKGQGDA